MMMLPYRIVGFKGSGLTKVPGDDSLYNVPSVEVAYQCDACKTIYWISCQEPVARYTCTHWTVEIDFERVKLKRVYPVGPEAMQSMLAGMMV